MRMIWKIESRNGNVMVRNGFLNRLNKQTA
jgi:hypothetical protein